MLKLDQNYSDYTDETDSEYPEGKAVNASTSESFDGTPLLASFMNNIIGAFQAMYKKAFGSTEGIDGNADTVNNSQFADAVAKYSDDRLATHADKRGENAHGATVAAIPGQLAARDEYGNLRVGDAIEDEDAVNLKTAEQMFDDANIKEAAHRDVDTVVTAGSANLPTSGAVNSALSNAMLNLMKTLYPVGSIKISENNVNPSTYITGTTWELKSQGRVLEGNDGAKWDGATVEAGLPNITGTFRVRNGGWMVDKFDAISGAFSKSITIKGTIPPGSGSTNEDGETLTFNAAQSNSIYGASSTVQPPAYFVYVWKRIA